MKQSAILQWLQGTAIFLAIDFALAWAFVSWSGDYGLQQILICVGLIWAGGAAYGLRGAIRMVAGHFLVRGKAVSVMAQHMRKSGWPTDRVAYDFDDYRAEVRQDEAVAHEARSSVEATAGLLDGATSMTMIGGILMRARVDAAVLKHLEKN